MKTITVNVSEPVYSEFQAFAKREDRKTAELIREAMDMYRRERISRPEQFDLRNAPLADVGDVLKPFDTARDDLLEEMTHDRRY